MLIDDNIFCDLTCIDIVKAVAGRRVDEGNAFCDVNRHDYFP